MRVCFKTLVFMTGILLFIVSSVQGQISLPGFGQKNAGSNDQKANALLHQHLPLDLDANSAYPTVPNEDLLGGPFRGRALPITLDTLTKPLPPGDYVLPMTFFCSEYSIHRPGAGTAYVLAPAKGTAAKAISTLLWRGMLTGHKPQELQPVSWAIQGSVSYDKMPVNYKKLVDELIPDMKNQVNGQAFADIETGFQGKVNKATKKISDIIGKGTGGYVHADIKVDVELNQSFGRLGHLGQMALDGENINSIVTNASLTDDQRTHALYEGQGTQAPPLPAANGPWSVIVPGVAYMRFTVHGGNLQSDNVMQIRILKPGNSTAAMGTRPHLVLAQYPQSTPSSPSLVGLVNGTVNQPALSQCMATNTPQDLCVAGSVDIGGLAAYSVATGTQSPLVTVSQPLPQCSPTSTDPSCKVSKLVAQIAIDNTIIADSEGTVSRQTYIAGEKHIFKGICFPQTSVGKWTIPTLGDTTHLLAGSHDQDLLIGGWNKNLDGSQILPALLPTDWAQTSAMGQPAFFWLAGKAEGLSFSCRDPQDNTASATPNLTIASATATVVAYVGKPGLGIQGDTIRLGPRPIRASTEWGVEVDACNVTTPNNDRSHATRDFFWVQTVQNGLVYTDSSGGIQTSPRNERSPVDYTGLDAGPSPGSAIYGTGLMLRDSPDVGLHTDGGVVRVQRTFTARSTLLWISPKEGSIPVPVSTISWGFNAEALNKGFTFPRFQGWTTIGGANSTHPQNGSQGRPANSYPSWSTAVIAGPTISRPLPRIPICQ